MTYEIGFWFLLVTLASSSVASFLYQRARRTRCQGVVDALRATAVVLRSREAASNDIEHSLNRSMAMGYDDAAEHIERHIVGGEPLTTRRSPVAEQMVSLRLQNRRYDLREILAAHRDAGDRS